MSRPNILVIFCDQLRRQALGIYGDPNVSTPNIDGLAHGGVCFSQACSTFPVCVPFRFTLMTGEYAHTRFVPAIEWRMSPAERTLADEFNEAGYDTIYCGKWHLHGGHSHLPHHSARKSNLTRIPPRFQGRWKKWLGFDVANNHFDTWYFEDDEPSPKPLSKYQTDGLFDLTMRHLESRRDAENPFFCILSVEPPHFPLTAPAEYLERWKDRQVTLPPNFFFADTHPTPEKKFTEADRAAAIANLRTYYAMIENLDDNVGRMMEFLDRQGLRDNTIVVFFSDHGQMDGSHFVRSVMKSHPYEESIGIPLIISDPRMPAPRPAVVADPVATEDLYPTLLGLAGLTPKQAKPGLNAAPLARGEQTGLPREGVLLEFVHDLRPGNFAYNESYWRGFRSKRYKYTVLGDVREGGKPWQFFDLQEDPGEMKNLVDDPGHRDLIAHHHRLMRDRMIETDDHYVLAPAYGLDGLNLWQHFG